ncbi:hypothetical protein RMSM_04455 [Rhodopirellula maiorica SM1]|uniref:Uncharacterized protein n=1 Tax=Rhodopirellula maiorica SM1 TaxID=1265738 RepID=M5RHE5_9BACT|nr:hypothetical protein RMSM_04455 [Rhodopirellula maiorica SM1]
MRNRSDKLRTFFSIPSRTLDLRLVIKQPLNQCQWQWQKCVLGICEKLSNFWHRVRHGSIQSHDLGL